MYFALAQTSGRACALPKVGGHGWCMCSQSVSLQCETLNDPGLTWLPVTPWGAAGPGPHTHSLSELILPWDVVGHTSPLITRLPLSGTL